MTTCVKEFAKFELNLDKSYFLLCNARNCKQTATKEFVVKGLMEKH